MRHFDPLRPDRVTSTPGQYEFTHGGNSINIYNMQTMDFIKNVTAGPHADCHSTSKSGRWLYMACSDGLHILDQQTLEKVKQLYVGWVYGTNVMPDGDTMLLHDWAGGILILKDIEDMEKIHVHKRIDVLGNNEGGYTLGGKGHFIKNDRFYLAASWYRGAVYIIDLENDYSFETFMEIDPALEMGDDLVVSRDKTKAYIACYRKEKSHVAVIDISNRAIFKLVPTGGGSCGLTMTNDEMYVICSNDQDNSITVIDTITDTPAVTLCASEGFDKLGIKGYIQGISIGVNDEVYVYCCNGNGALVRFRNIFGNADCTVSWKEGQYTFPV